MPEHYVPTEQARRFRIAVAEHLGLDPAKVSGTDFRVEVTGDDFGRVSLVAFVPQADLVRLFNESHAEQPEG
jgi:hypothetical protein